MSLLSAALLILTTTLSCTATDKWQNSTWNLEGNPSRTQPEDHMDLPWTTSLHRSPNQGFLPVIRPVTRGARKKSVVTPEKKTKAKLAADNNTGLRKSNADHSNRLPTNVFPAPSPLNEFPDPHKPLQDRNLLDSPNLPGADVLLDHENNRPGKMSLQKLLELSYNSSKPGWMTNRHPSSLLHQFTGFRKEFESKERSCLTECHKNRDEREAYCYSDFAVNGIVHDVDTLGKGIQILTILVNSGGLYKINRLYITPDGFFFKVKVLAVDHLNCPKSCLDFKLGGRYIIMGQIFHKRMELPPSIQRTVSGRLRAGDGLVTGSSSFVRRYNRKKDRKVLAAAHSKCK